MGAFPIPYIYRPMYGVFEGLFPKGGASDLQGSIGEGRRTYWGRLKGLLGKPQRPMGEASRVYGGRLKGLLGKKCRLEWGVQMV